MAATNIFYRLPSQRGTRIASIAGTECTLDQFCNYIIDIEGLNRRDFIIASGTKVFRPNSCSLQTINLQNNSHVDILIPLLGGKGGFGSLLRAIGAQIEKTTNRDACRDLSGRRLRDIKREEELKKLLELKAKLEEEQRERKRQKLEKLKSQSEKFNESASIQELVSMFKNHEFNKRRLEIGDILDAAVEKGLINARKRELESDDKSFKRSKLVATSSKDKECSSGDEADENKEKSADDLPGNLRLVVPTSRSNPGREHYPRCNTKTDDIWLGLEEDGSDNADDTQNGAHDDDLKNEHCGDKLIAAQR